MILMHDQQNPLERDRHFTWSMPLLVPIHVIISDEKEREISKYGSKFTMMILMHDQQNPLTAYCMHQNLFATFNMQKSMKLR